MGDTDGDKGDGGSGAAASEGRENRVVIEEVSVAIDRRPLLAPVSATVEPGTCLAVRGENGSGKTTLLRVVAGLLRPSSGRVRIGDQVVDERLPRTRQQVATLLGGSAAYRDLTVWEHLLLIDASWGGDEASVDHRAGRVLDLLRIEGLADRFPHQLSSGQSHLVDLALVLFRPGDVLVLDEPEQRLDDERRAIVADVLRDRADAGATVLMATHDAELTEAVADEVLTLTTADHEAAGG
ncbi:ABC transporter ATP-binding protein [Janibacter alkaliphilus]|uniref:ABC-type multidrug transport system ATPase subunit n=1 Tax=Janibacter alkaliphilus TaxID=1069963 RepID=A0A852XDN9_9MICO|nr:ABC transporter ATP-binding protein [Janibacter alkaliphilus]NYG38554.1 ABC-type multidrug transport system ATPase subunit [Janibacter alkaliphilus]